MKQTYIKEYIRDEQTRNPIGIAVAVRINDEVFYGFSICNRVDRFDKQLGLNIALSRAHSDEFKLPLSERYQHLINKHFSSLEHRALQYFADVNPQNILLERNAIPPNPFVHA